MANKVVLVTGITGFIGSHVAKVLINHGFRVKGTVRSLANEKKMKLLGELFTNSVEFVEADLTKDDGWENAMVGCTTLIHVASPFPNVAEQSIKEDDVVKPAIDGTMRAIKAAVKANIKRIVLTSSIVSICAESEYDAEHVFTEEDKANGHSETIDVYSKSKILAEEAAWEYLHQLKDDEKFELTVINPSFVLGPVLLEYHKSATSVSFICQIMNRVYPAHPKLSMNFCDVRDVANAHLKALTTSAASGKRYIIFSERLWMKDIAALALEEFEPQGYSISTSELPYFVCWFAGVFNKGMRSYILPRFGKPAFTLSNRKMIDVLGIEPTPVKKSVNDMVYSLVEIGSLKKTRNYKGVSAQ